MNVQMYEDRMMPLLLNISGVYMDFVLLRNLEEVGGGGEDNLPPTQSQIGGKAQCCHQDSNPGVVLHSQ
jgi:hypothetical protein